MVAQLRLFAPPQELVQVLLGRPGRAVDALEHLALLVAAPVRAGDREQLERPDLAGGGDVRAAAQVDEWALAVERRGRHRLAGRLGLRGQVVDDLDLERLVLSDQEGASLGRGQLGSFERVIGGDAGRHAGLDGGEVVRGQVPGQQDVVVEAVADGRADAELRPGEEVQDRLGHDVRGRVAHRAEFVLGTGVQQLVRRPALGCLQDLVHHQDRFVAHRACLRRITEPLVHRQDERFTPAVPPAFAGRACALWGRANGRLPGRFTGRSRVVPPGSIAGFPASSRLSVDRATRRRVPIDAVFVLWWATLDSNQ